MEDGWPKNAGLHCWWCVHPFEGTAVAAPLSYDDRTCKFRVYGNFCSFACVGAYLNSDPLYAGNNTKSVFEYMKRKCSVPRYVIDAPPRYVLKCFGGPLSIEEFRESTKYSQYKIVKHPCIPLESHVQEVSFTEKVNSVPKDAKLSGKKNNKKLSTLGFTVIKKQASG